MRAAPSHVMAVDWYTLGASLAARAADHPPGSAGRRWCIQNAKDALRAARETRRRNRPHGRA